MYLKSLVSKMAKIEKIPVDFTRLTGTNLKNSKQGSL
jgi:hypothetical protein